MKIDKIRSFERKHINEDGDVHPSSQFTFVKQPPNTDDKILCNNLRKYLIM